MSNDRKMLIDGAFERPPITRDRIFQNSYGVTLLCNRPGGGNHEGGLQPLDLNEIGESSNEEHDKNAELEEEDHDICFLMIFHYLLPRGIFICCNCLGVNLFITAITFFLPPDVAMVWPIELLSLINPPWVHISASAMSICPPILH